MLGWVYWWSGRFANFLTWAYWWVGQHVFQVAWLGLIPGLQNVWRWAQFLRWGHSWIKPKYLGWAYLVAQPRSEQDFACNLGGKPRSFSIFAWLGPWRRTHHAFPKFCAPRRVWISRKWLLKNCQWPSLWSYILYVYLYTCGRPPRSYLSQFWMVFFPYKIQGLQKQNMICCLISIINALNNPCTVSGTRLQPTDHITWSPLIAAATSH